MLFDDDIKIDLTLLPVERLEEYLTWDKLVRVLLDKDGRIQNPPVPTDEDYRLRKPTERMVDDCCNEFWNVTTYVVKGCAAMKSCLPLIICTKLCVRSCCA